MTRFYYKWESNETNNTVNTVCCHGIYGHDSPQAGEKMDTDRIDCWQTKMKSILEVNQSKPFSPRFLLTRPAWDGYYESQKGALLLLYFPP